MRKRNVNYARLIFLPGLIVWNWIKSRNTWHSGLSVVSDSGEVPNGPNNNTDEVQNTYMYNKILDTRNYL